ncbi:Lacal_2735 family protein [Tenacibaculum sp. C7A-26P2]|uniref:Lacal_2735 family protein n=1 Tax=Tenacibaculum sp. C7A-26P2 TaxID=3447504 RepID=UPI003F87D94D
MLRINQIQCYKEYLEERYDRLIERSNDYRYVDECKSDRSAFKAMKILDKLNKIKYLNKELSNSAM